MAISDGRGRYCIEMAVAHPYPLPNPSVVVIHDTSNLQDDCGVTFRGFSYFGDLEWAERKGYRRCFFCFQRLTA